MRIQTTLISLALCYFLLAPPFAFGHGSAHSHEITQKEAEVIATKSVSQLVDKGKIDKSWKSIKVAKSEMKKLSDGMEWMVIFSNKKIEDPGKQTLYVFLGMDGEYLATNYTGN